MKNAKKRISTEQGSMRASVFRAHLGVHSAFRFRGWPSATSPYAGCKGGDWPRIDPRGSNGVGLAICSVTVQLAGGLDRQEEHVKTV